MPAFIPWHHLPPPRGHRPFQRAHGPCSWLGGLEGWFCSPGHPGPGGGCMQMMSRPAGPLAQGPSGCQNRPFPQNSRLETGAVIAAWSCSPAHCQEELGQGAQTSRTPSSPLLSPPACTPGKGVAVGPLLGAGRELIGLELCASTSLGTGRVGEGCSRLCDGPGLPRPAASP